MVFAWKKAHRFEASMWLASALVCEALAEGLGESENEREDRDEEGDLLVGGIDVDVGFGHSASPFS